MKNVKRFDEGEFGDFGYWIEDTLTGEKIRNEKVVDLLNEMSEENEQLRKELDSFKPVMFQDVRKGTVILYSKGDIDE